MGNRRIIIATHVYTTGPAQDLLEYLNKNKTKDVLFIGHPLFFDKKLNSSGFEIYKEGSLKKKSYKKIKKIPEFLAYLKDFILNIFWGLRTKGSWDIFFGCNNLNAFSGIILKKLGKVRKVIYYTIDYNPKRFENVILNKIYHMIDRFAVRNSDETWNLSPRMEEARKKYFDFTGGNQKVVPIGIWFKRFPRKNFSQIEKHTLCFMGHITKKQGIQYVLEAVPDIAKEIPDFKFLVIGGGNYLEKLLEKVKDFYLEKNVEFTGYIEKHTDVEKILSKCSCAIAIYEKYDKNGNLSFTNFSDSGKIKSYLAGGLPVFVSDVPYNAKEIHEKRCGFVITKDPKKIAKSIISFLKDERLLEEFRKNAIEYSKNYDWKIIFEKNLNKTF